MMRKSKILYIEDDKITRTVISMNLKKINNVILEIAEDGIEGYEKYRSFKPDIIVTDMKMPNMNGIELMQTIRTENKNIYSIMTTSTDSSDLLLKAIKTNINDFLIKPVQIDDLTKSIEKAIYITNLQNTVKEQHEFTKSILDNIENLVFIKDKNKIIEANKLFYLFFNISELEKYKIDSINKFFHLIVEGNCVNFDIENIEYNIEYKIKSKFDFNEKKFFLLKKKVLPNTNYEMIIMNDITTMEQQRYELEILSSIDPLTKLLNRRKFNTILKYELVSNTIFTLIMMDIDHFKKVNDTYGHDIGDEVLISISKLLTTTFDGEIARFGGEEFVILIKGVKENNFKVVENFRKKVSELKFSLDFKITSSFGMTDTKESKKSEILLKIIDNLLYDSKNNGRNQITMK